VQFTTGLTMLDPSFYAPLAREAEACGYSAIHIADSICYPQVSSSTYPYNSDGTREFLEHKPFIEPFALISALSMVTERVQFVTSVLKLPIRHPVITAKQVTSVAVLSGGRLQLGVGTSPWPDDYEVVGLPWAGRGRRFEEDIAIIRALATGGYVAHEGEFHTFPAIKMSPVPAEPVPILIGGHGPKNIDRAARIGDGWISARSTWEDLTERLARLRELRKRYERDHLPFAIHATTAESLTVDGVRRLEDLGVTHTVGGYSAFNPYAPGPDTEPLQDKIDALRRYADTVISKVGPREPA